MIKEIDIAVSPRIAATEKLLLNQIAKKARIPVFKIESYKIIRRSIDARTARIKVNLKIKVSDEQTPLMTEKLEFDFPDVSNAPAVVVAGSGPAGMFGALRLIEKGLRPIIIERGKDVHERKRDIAQLQKNHIVNENSNYCFGEGGAGTFSDGKLYTRSKKRGDIRNVLELFVFHGASEEILIDAHPHIGTNKLSGIMENMRNTIKHCGGDVLFNTKLVDIELKNNAFSAAITDKGQKIEAVSLLLGTGHSARDIFMLLHEKGIAVEQKPFAMGVRAEHPQEMINRIQYHNHPEIEFLPPASYSLVHQSKGKGVYSFCMCPGGIIVPSATDDDCVVVNGMSNAKRSSPYANSGIIVEITEEDTAQFAEHGPLAGLMYQIELEKMAKQHNGGGQTAPAQRITDFYYSKVSKSLPDSSYVPGISSSPMHEWLPDNISSRLQHAFKTWGKRMHGYFSAEGIITGVESRSSSPVRIPRDKETFEHPQIKGIFPAGEGAGYAGGIVSSAIDGQKCAEKISEFYK